MEEGDRILDVGCGTGSLAVILSFEDNFFDVVTSTFMFHHLSMALKKEKQAQ